MTPRILAAHDESSSNDVPAAGNVSEEHTTKPQEQNQIGTVSMMEPCDDGSNSNVTSSSSSLQFFSSSRSHDTEEHNSSQELVFHDEDQSYFATIDIGNSLDEQTLSCSDSSQIFFPTGSTDSPIRDSIAMMAMTTSRKQQHLECEEEGSFRDVLCGSPGSDSCGDATASTAGMSSEESSEDGAALEREEMQPLGTSSLSSLSESTLPTTTTESGRGKRVKRFLEWVTLPPRPPVYSPPLRHARADDHVLTKIFPRQGDVWEEQHLEEEGTHQTKLSPLRSPSTDFTNEWESHCRRRPHDISGDMSVDIEEGVFNHSSHSSIPLPPPEHEEQFDTPPKPFIRRHPSYSSSSPPPASPQPPLILFGCDISHLSPTIQFIICASGVFGFTIVYGYLQELLSVHIAGRKYALFLATCQFAGYAFWSLILTRLRSKAAHVSTATRHSDTDTFTKEGMEVESGVNNITKSSSSSLGSRVPAQQPPLRKFVWLSIIRAIDLGMTNLAMQYMNYPAKTLIKSSRVVFTMLLGLVIGHKRYKARDYVAVMTLVVGLFVFLHADTQSNAVFHPIGVLMLMISLTCDGTVNNWAEQIMKHYSLGQDEFQLKLYSIALLAMTAAAHLNHELISGARFVLFTPGTIAEIESGEYLDRPVTWTVSKKIIVLLLFSTTGLFGSSCAGAITKRFGALSMSITSTARKGGTLFLSFALFPNKCTIEHVVGIALFLSALLMKSLSAKYSINEGSARGRIKTKSSMTEMTGSNEDGGDDGENEEDLPLLEKSTDQFQWPKRTQQQPEAAHTVNSPPGSPKRNRENHASTPQRRCSSVNMGTDFRFD